MTSLVDQVYFMANGQVETPATEGPSAVRWGWFADLYAHPHWGLVTVPGFSQAEAQTVASLCRATPIASVDSISARWDVFEQLAAIKLDRAPSDFAWAAVANSAIDARDYLAGGNFSGAETVTSAFWAHFSTQPAAVAESQISAAIEAWNTRFHSSARGAAA
ncbi:hypothetical protein JWS13_05255 (plasmid) [Rhodococcus pseudokoreensis]|uniref:Uncharacterized protein n=1 Tax=Rhodococcus pseudokoreensis TaxID=2811421 RepID=A0A974VYU8_9NOCA|nr:hypothetical protein [Rhodococcus pseudokoreensis]QSE88064.1 hypothetical protein JWS13_05255 [Rhodococcus pseudokoreensis]